MFLQSVYYPTNALCHTTHTIYINSYMFRHRGAIIRELLQQRCTSQPANICIKPTCQNMYKRMILYDIFVNCNWVVTRWQKYSTHLHTNNTQNDTKQTIHRTIQQFWKSACRAPSWLVIPWHLPYNRGKSTEKPQSG